MRHFPAFAGSDFSPVRTVITAATQDEARRIATRLWPWAGSVRVVNGCRPDRPGGCGGKGCNGTLVRVPWQEGKPWTLPSA